MPDPNPKEVLEFAHDSNVWSLAYHPLGHILVSASNDHTTRFWSRNRPGQKVLNDRFHLGRDGAREAGNQEEDEQEDDFVPGFQNNRPPQGFTGSVPNFSQRQPSSFAPPSGGGDFIPGFEVPGLNNGPPSHMMNNGGGNYGQGYGGGRREDDGGRGYGGRQGRPLPSQQESLERFGGPGAGGRDFRRGGGRRDGGGGRGRPY